MLMHHSCIPLPRSFSPCLALSRSYWKCALKLKEIPCIHAEAYLAGELKHGPVAHVIPVQMLALPCGAGARYRRRQAAQPGQERDGGVRFAPGVD